MVLKSESKEERIHNDFLWVSRNTPLLQKKYEGRWIAIINKRVVGSGKTATEAYRQAKKKHPEKEPLLDLVPHKELMVL